MRFGPSETRYGTVEKFAKFSMSDRRGVSHRTRSHGKHKAPPAEPTTLCRVSYSFRLVEGIVAEREEDDVVVRVQAGVRSSRSSGRRHPASPRDSTGCARKQTELHIFIFQADPGAAEIAFINVLPETDGKFLNALDVG